MAVNAVNSSTQTAPLTNGFAKMDSSEFIRVLISELRHQDPFNPQDSAALLEQLSSLRNIESQTMLGDQMTTLTTQFTTFFKQNQISSASSLVGKYIKAIDPTDGDQVFGLVRAVNVTKDGVFLELDNGASFNLNDVVSIANAPGDIAAL